MVRNIATGTGVSGSIAVYRIRFQIDVKQSGTTQALILQLC
jgi:hypothetical protein